MNEVTAFEQANTLLGYDKSDNNAVSFRTMLLVTRGDAVATTNVVVFTKFIMRRMPQRLALKDSDCSPNPGLHPFLSLPENVFPKLQLFCHDFSCVNSRMLQDSTNLGRRDSYVPEVFELRVPSSFHSANPWRTTDDLNMCFEIVDASTKLLLHQMPSDDHDETLTSPDPT